MPDIMIIDDLATNIQLLVDVLGDHEYTIRPTTNPHFALTSAMAAPPDLVLLDVNMPDMNGFELCQTLKKQPAPLCDVPIVFISAYGDTDKIVKGFEVGGVDYICKPFNPPEVLARVRTQLELQQQRQKIEELHQQEVERLTQMNQLKDEVLRIASHDLRNPLSIIRGFTDLLLIEEVLDEDNVRPVLKHIDKAVQKMDDFLYDLLDTVRIEGKLKLNLVKISLTDHLTMLFDENRLHAQTENLTLELDLPPDDSAFITVDEKRFEQIIQNLLSNAIKYTPAGGTVTLSLDGNEHEVSIHVHDNGPGIPAESLPHLFDKFYRVYRQEHKKIEGTGLGLAIVKALVKQLNGRIDVTSKLGEGSTFSVTFPRHSSSKPSPTGD